ncbi:MAG: hypothetical protein ACT4P0_02900 [Panacagrimonas sp.]
MAHQYVGSKLLAPAAKMLASGKMQLQSWMNDRLPEMLWAGRRHFLEAETLEALANEDVMEEFLDLDLGHWNKSDLRKMSIESGTKDDYDAFYGWPLAFVHGHWRALSDISFDNCINSLHRVHRIRRAAPRQLPSVRNDALRLAKLIIGSSAKLYPGLDLDLSLGQTATSGSAAPP